MERSKVDMLLESIFIEEGPEGIVESMSFLYGAFVVTRNGLVLGANKAFCDLLDYPLTQLRGKPATDLVAKEQKDYLAQIFESNSHTPYDLSLVTKNGEVRHTRVSPKIFTVRGELYRLAEFVDFTSYFPAQRTLVESETKFKTFFQHASIGIARISLQGDWQEFNPQFCNFLGLHRRAVTQDKLCRHHLPGRYRNRPRPFQRSATPGKPRSYSLEKPFFPRDPPKIWARPTGTLYPKPLLTTRIFIIFFIEKPR